MKRTFITGVDKEILDSDEIRRLFEEPTDKNTYVDDRIIELAERLGKNLKEEAKEREFQKNSENLLNCSSCGEKYLKILLIITKNHCLGCYKELTFGTIPRIGHPSPDRSSLDSHVDLFDWDSAVKIYENQIK